MGHIHEQLVGYGSNEREAYSYAISDYQSEYGWSHEIRETLSSKLLERIPPRKRVKKMVPQVDYRTRRPTGVMVEIETQSEEPDLEAPKDQWIERWLFEIDVHI